MTVLEGEEGNVGVDGSSELSGDIVCGERSSARTTSAGVPLGIVSIRRPISKFPETWQTDLRLRWSS